METKRLTLLDPKHWEDQNDAFFLRRYKEQTKLKTLLALCFATEGESYHLWKVFSGTASGVKIEFDRSGLLESFQNVTGIRTGNVDYEKVRDLERDPPKALDLPFLKRFAYRDEREFRIIYEDKNKSRGFKQFHIDLSCIKDVVLSPWLPQPVVGSVRSIVKSRLSAPIRVFQSTLLENEKWKALASGTIVGGD